MASLVASLVAYGHNRVVSVMAFVVASMMAYIMASPIALIVFCKRYLVLYLYLLYL